MTDTLVNTTDTAISISVLQFPQNVQDWDLVTSFLSLRKKVFIERMSWELHQCDGIEFEQYDTVETVYVVAHRGRKALGGARLRRTDHILGSGRLVYSYMIRDASLGLLPQLPSNLCSCKPPVASDIWELTRLASIGDHSISRSVLQAANRFLFEKKATSCLFLGPPAFLRIARSMGWRPEAMGPVVGNQDGRFLAFRCKVKAPDTRNDKGMRKSS